MTELELQNLKNKIDYTDMTLGNICDVVYSDHSDMDENGQENKPEESLVDLTNDKRPVTNYHATQKEVLDFNAKDENPVFQCKKLTNDILFELLSSQKMQPTRHQDGLLYLMDSVENKTLEEPMETKEHRRQNRLRWIAEAVVARRRIESCASSSFVMARMDNSTIPVTLEQLETKERRRQNRLRWVAEVALARPIIQRCNSLRNMKTKPTKLSKQYYT